MTLDLVVQVADITERVQVTSGLSDLNFTAAAMFAVDETKLDALTVGSLLESPLSCLESLLIASEVTEAELSLKDVMPLTQEKGSWGKLENFRDALSDIFFAARLAIVDILLPHTEQIAQRLVKPVLNDLLEQAVSYVVFEREAREYKWPCFLIRSRKCQFYHSYHLYHRFISLENHSNSNAQMHTLKYNENSTRASRSNTGTHLALPCRTTQQRFRR